MQSINPAEVAPARVHDLLLSAVAPRPIAFVSTVDDEGNFNLAPFSFFNVFSSNPPVLIFSPARSGRTGETKHTHDNVVHTPECVVNIAHFSIAQQMNLAAGMYPKGTNEFEKSGLTPIASITVKPPRVAECFVQLECVVNEVIELGQSGGAGNLIICEVKMIHIHDEVMNKEGGIDPYKMDYIGRMGKQYWTRVLPENMVTLPSFKMANELGIGFDALPEGIRTSKYLSGNDIAQIASNGSAPSEKDLFDMGPVPEIQTIISKYGADFADFEREMHLLAKQEIEQENLWFAFKILMIVEFTRDDLNKQA